jgi:hypothetical protein
MPPPKPASPALPLAIVTPEMVSLTPAAIYAYALNNSSQVQVVGHSEFGADMHATLWQNGKAIDLNTQLPRKSGWLLEHAYGVNDAGWIVGEGQNGSGPHAVLITPISGKAGPAAHTTTSGIILTSSQTTAPSAPAVGSAPNSGPARHNIQAPTINSHAVSMHSGNLVTVDWLFAEPGQATSSGLPYDDLVGLWAPGQELSVAH